MKLGTVLALATVLLSPALLTGCNEEGVGAFVAGAKQYRPLRPDLIKLMDTKGMRKEDPILVRTFKEDNTLEIWKRDKTGKFALLRSYQMCAWGGTIGPKIREGDKQSPEGFYTVTPSRMNPNSQFYLAFDIGYPNSFDRAFGRTGAAVMVHGNCTASAGCFVMTDQQVEEIYALAREALAAGQPTIQVQAFPFRMTAANMAKHRKNPNLAFWRNIKEGYDHFELTKLEPKVDVCDKHYVFDAQATSQNSTTFNAAGACPSYQMQEQVATLMKAKEAADDLEFKTVVAELDTKEKAAADAERQAKEAERLAKIEAAKPKQPSMIASLLGAKPSEETTGSVTAEVTPPVSAAKPGARTPQGKPVQTLAVASADPVALQAVQAPKAKPEGNVFGNLFGFAAQPSAPPPQQPAVVAPVPAAASPAPVASVQPAKPGMPLPKPTAAPVQASVQPAKPAPANEPAWWQKLNPFGG